MNKKSFTTQDVLAIKEAVWNLEDEVKALTSEFNSLSLNHRAIKAHSFYLELAYIYLNSNVAKLIQPIVGMEEAFILPLISKMLEKFIGANPVSDLYNQVSVLAGFGKVRVSLSEDGTTFTTEDELSSIFVPTLD